MLRTAADALQHKATQKQLEEKDEQCRSDERGRALLKSRKRL
jgi:hypothetical protein